MDIHTYLANFSNENEKPLDNLVEDGGFCSILRTVGCVGDSLSSGDFEAYKDGAKIYLDFYDYSWGQFLARMAGCKVYNFSKGGMTAQEYMETFADKQLFWNTDKACQAYVIALGVNDVINKRQEVGSLSDICPEDWRKNKPTFAGFYAQVIQRLKEIQPDAKFFFVTIPRNGTEPTENEQIRDAHAALLHEMAGFFSNSYVIDLRRYAPVYDEAFRIRFFMGGHMNPCGYVLTAKMIVSYIDYIIRHNVADFREIAFVGTPYRNGRLEIDRR